MSEEVDTLKLYPIQAIHIGPRELYIKANEPPSESLGMEGSDCDLVIGHSDYDPTEKLIKIAIKAEAGRSAKSSEGSPEGESKDLPPFHLRIEMIGIFAVDDSMFPPDRIYEWANSNALFIMYPYLREHVFALTVRAGFKPLLLPLVEVPLFRITPNLSPAELPTAHPQPS